MNDGNFSNDLTHDAFEAFKKLSVEEQRAAGTGEVDDTQRDGDDDGMG